MSAPDGNIRSTLRGDGTTPQHQHLGSLVSNPIHYVGSVFLIPVYLSKRIKIKFINLVVTPAVILQKWCGLLSR